MNYVGDNACSKGILEKQLVVPSWDATGGATEETARDKFLQIVNQSIAAGSSESFGVIANRTRCRIATSLYSSIAFNALTSSNKLLPAVRRANSGNSFSKSPKSSGGRGRGKRSGAEFLAAAARAEEVRAGLSQSVRAGLSQSVREAELAEISRAAAVAVAQQLKAQALVVDDPPTGLLLLLCAASGVGGPQLGASGDSYCTVLPDSARLPVYILPVYTA